MIEELVLAEEPEDCILFSIDEELNLSVFTISLRIKGSEGWVGDVVTMVGRIGDDKPDEERDLTKGKKCFKREDTEHKGGGWMDWGGPLSVDDGGRGCFS